MFLSIVYFVSIILLLISFLLIKKSLKKQNLLLWIFISQLIIFCYNSIAVYILSALYIHSTLLTLSIINFIISIIITFLSIKKRHIQQYYINKYDVIAVIVLAVLVIIIGYLRFGFPFQIIYETCDPGTHFWTSMDFFRESILLNKADTAIDFSARVFGSYVNMGLIFKMFYPFVGYVNLYMVYIMYDLYMLFMSGIIFYFFARYLFNEKNFYSIILISIIYLAGYPLNSMLFGFFYSGHVVTLLCLLILFFKFIDNKELFKKFTLCLIAILNIGICFTYYLYTPIVLIVEIVYFVYKFKYLEKYDIKKLIVLLLTIVGIPLTLTILYFVIPYIGTNQHSIFYQLKLDGYFYNSYLSNFIFFIPPIVYYFVIMLKKRKINFEMCLLILVIGFIILIITLSMFDLAVQYYASKFYYALWLLCFILLFNLYNLKVINKTCSNIYILTIIVVLIFSVFRIEDKLYDKNTAFGNRIESSNFFNIYSWNIDKIQYSNITFTLEEIDIIRKLYDLNAENVVNNFIESFNSQRLWLNAFFWNEKLDYPENEVYDYVKNGIFFDPYEQQTYSKINNNYKYYVIFYRDFSKKRWINYKDIYPFEVQRRWDDNFKIDYTINRKKDFDIADRSSCVECEFIDFKYGVIILNNNANN